MSGSPADPWCASDELVYSMRSGLLTIATIAGLLDGEGILSR